jgi:hypothetical protein
VKVTVKSLPEPIFKVQGVLQLGPSEVLAAAPAGFDSISSSVVVGFGLSESKPGMDGVDTELHDARPMAIAATAPP